MKAQNRPQSIKPAEATNYPTNDAESQQSKAGEEPVQPEASTHTIPAEATNYPADDAGHQAPVLPKNLCYLLRLPTIPPMMQ